MAAFTNTVMCHSYAIFCTELDYYEIHVRYIKIPQTFNQTNQQV